MLRKPINPNWLEYGKQSKVIEKEHMHMLKEALEKQIHWIKSFNEGLLLNY